MARRSIFISLVFVASISACRPAAAPINISNRPVSINDVKLVKPLGEMSWTDEDGALQKVSDLRGKVLILDFWATYCIPCKEEIPHLNQLAARHGDTLQVIGLNAGGDEDKPKIPAFRYETPIQYKLAFPEDDLISFIFGDDSRIPQTVVIDRNGRLVKKIIGFSEQIRSELDAAVDQAVRQ